MISVETDRSEMKNTTIRKHTAAGRWIRLFLLFAMLISLSGCKKHKDIREEVKDLRNRTELFILQTDPKELDELMTHLPGAETEILDGVENVSEESDLAGSSQGISEDPEEKEIVVHVCGAVKDAGVYAFADGARIEDAVCKAGGFTEEADTDYLNLAQRLSDGQQIRIPTKEETEKGLAAYDNGSEEEAAGQKKAESSDGKVHLNTATREMLMTLPGIGEAKADSILAYRTEHGAFRSVDELKNISGIKDGVYDRIKDAIAL